LPKFFFFFYVTEWQTVKVYEHQFIFAASRTFKGVFVLATSLHRRKRALQIFFWLTCQKFDAEKTV
jgi:hypothetical protein